jgi:hypothetical protein
VKCHTSSGRYRFREEKDANNACMPCHKARVEHAAAHTHHKAGSPGNKCISCHMPMTSFARMSRSDHSMLPPTPAATIAYKSPNACTLCHTDKDAAWADKTVREWHPRDYQAPVLARAALIEAGRKRDWSKLPAMLDYVKEAQPRVLFVGYGETDSWAHSGRYDLVLTAARQVDRFVEQLWNTMQSMPQYRGKTTFIVTTDHGRGSGPVDWKEHGIDSPGSDDIWIAVIGPDTPARGERRDVPPVTQAQVAATLAAFLGRDFRKAVPKAAAPLPDVIAPAPYTGHGKSQ